MSIEAAPTTTASPRALGKGWNIALWVLQVLAALAFLGAGAAKLSGVPEMVKNFETIGLGQWFRYLTGGIEVASAIALLIPRLAGFGALLLSATMVGAVIAHLTKLGGTPVPAIVLLAIVATIAYGRLVAGRKPSAIA